MKQALNLIHYALGLVLLISTLFISPTEAIEKKTPENSDSKLCFGIAGIDAFLCAKKTKIGSIQGGKVPQFS